MLTLTGLMKTPRALVWSSRPETILTELQLRSSSYYQLWQDRGGFNDFGGQKYAQTQVRIRGWKGVRSKILQVMLFA